MQANAAIHKNATSKLKVAAITPVETGPASPPKRCRPAMVETAFPRCTTAIVSLIKVSRASSQIAIAAPNKKAMNDNKSAD